MNKKEQVEYTDEPIQFGEEVPNFLPRPEELVFKNLRRKITITLDQDSIYFFKPEAKRLGVPYQRMIRNLLHEYVDARRQSNPAFATHK